MGMRGPKPKLPAMEILDGRPGKKPLLGEFLEATGEAFVPDHLSDAAQACMEVCKASLPDRTYSQADTYLLAAFAEAWAAHRELTHQMRAPGFKWTLANKDDREYPNPVVTMRNNQAQLIATLGDRLGLNPKARIGIRIPDEKQPRTKFSGLLGQSVSSPFWSA
jgi:P27 family predicted phage terminase small subunit